MTASEFAFLALGLVLGTAAGAALIEVLRARPPVPREVRVTMAPQTVPTRSATLAGDPFEQGLVGPAPFGPGDRRSADRPGGNVVALDQRVGPPARRPALLAVAVGPGTSARIALPPASARTPVHMPAVGVAAISSSRPWAASAAVAVAERPPIAIVASSAQQEDPASGMGTGADVSARPRPVADGPCGELRATAEDRCAVAARARQTSDTALTALREAQRASDDASRQADEADAIADPRAVRAAKEAAQQAFRMARERSGTRDELEAAARTWLAAINRINLDARDATARAARSRTAANELVTTIERLTAEADAARVASEVAEEACLTARQAVADCEEAESLAAAAAVAPAPLPAIEPAARFPDDEPELAFASPGESEPRVLRLLRGDRAALLRTVTELGGEDPAERRRWQIALTALVDAIVAQAIDASIVEVPDEQAFWAPFTPAQRREIVAALASLGYRFDGLDGFADDRVPSQRDLSLAVGYAGLDPMRVRRWPTEVEARELLVGVRVAADEYLAATAGGMTLSELVDLLGRRADGLTDLWNDWGRVRGRLLAPD